MPSSASLLQMGALASPYSPMFSSHHLGPLDYFIDDCRQAVARTLSNALGIEFNIALSGVDLSKKDYHFTVALPRFRLKDKPQDLVEKLQSYATNHPDPLLGPPIMDGAFAHFVIRQNLLVRSVLSQVFNSSLPTPDYPSGSYGSNSSGLGKKVVLEFSSPNIAKPFHAGHLRSTIIGAFLSNLYAENGWEVIRINYLGDWGVQYGMLAVGFHLYGSEEELAKDPIMHLFDVYVKVSHNEGSEEWKERFAKARQLFKAMADGMAFFWELSIEAYKQLYSRLNIAFNDYSGESTVSDTNLSNLLLDLHSKKLFTGKTKEESNPKRNYRKGPPPVSDPEEILASAIDLNEFRLEKPVIQKPDGTTTYLARDIVAATQRHEKYQFDKMVYVVGDQQNLHCSQLFKIVEIMGKSFAGKLEHIAFGAVKGMSTRKGEVKFLSDILDTARDTMLAQMQKNESKLKNVQDPVRTSDQIGMTCVKIQDMQAKRAMSYAFDWDRMTSFEGDTGAYLQYAHARLCSVERNAGVTLCVNTEDVDTDLLSEPKAAEIAYLLAIYPEVVKTALKVSEPSTIVFFCFKLSHLVSSAWDTLIVKGQEKRLAEARLLLFVCARQVLSRAMHLLTLTPLEAM